MSWLFSQALVEEYLEGNSSDGEPSAPLNGNPTQLAYLPPDRMTAFSRLSRFGMTFKPLTEDRGKELLTLFLEAFPAKTSQPQEKARELTENDQGCGEKWHGWLAKYDPDSCSWKTPQCSLLGEEQESLATLPRWGMTVGGLLWELPTLEPITKEIGCGLWLGTPTATMSVRSSNFQRPGMTPSEFVQKYPNKEKFPTPQSSDWKNKNHSRDYTLGNMKYVWPTPRQRDYKDGKTIPPSRIQHPELSTLGQKVIMEGAIGGSLNPTWVEWLMGWPLGWTDLRPLEMDKSLSVQQKHGDS